jgi:hypothetical protein
MEEVVIHFGLALMKPVMLYVASDAACHVAQRWTLLVILL